MLSKPSWGKKKGSTPFQLPSDDIEGWLRKVNSSSAGQRAVEQKAGRNISAGSWSAGHPAKRPSTLDHSGTQEKRKRHDMPVVRKIDRAAMATAQEKISTGTGRRDALDALVNDFYASSSQAPRTSQLKTWERYHATWYGDQVPVWPLSEQSLVRVSALFKLGGYKSFKNYLSRAKDHHISLGFEWSDKLDAVARKCSRSVLRGLAGSTRSMDFDLVRISSHLPHGSYALDECGPAHPKAMVVTATLFLLRELEASAIDLEDVVFDDAKVTLHLPVSKTDWQAKGCSRSWACVCDTQLPCVYHTLKQHMVEVNNFYCNLGMRPVDKPLFPTTLGGYCTKQGVVNTLRAAVDQSGGNATKGDRSSSYSGHAFRITGARLLARSGLACITIQLLGRWGSNAILSYLAESPLDGFADRLRHGLSDKKLDKWVFADNSPAFREADQLVYVQDMMAELKQSKDKVNQLESQLNNLAIQMEDTSQILEGVELTFGTKSGVENWMVDNGQSKVRHRSIVDLSTPPATWKTLCGWNFSSKAHATTSRSVSEQTDLRLCPRCFPSDSDHSSSSSSSSSED